ncbi:hypothetical protein RJ640_026873 [Escallonia rubra]|uniref:Uncharacterized protein n=1 Tax=Escallonia rubra TaxID=112253 RepID=A0AA88UGG2_9ASTE|nr:hypothetical protein RJ640_026873 [Escallonia rubra]
MGGETERTAAASKNEEKQAQVDIRKGILGFTESAVMKCAVELGIADALENSGGPMSLFELSSSLGCSPPALYRIMRFLVHRGIFSQKSTSQGSTGYVQTPISRLLVRHGENSMAGLVLFLSSPMLLALWQCLSARVLACETSAFEAAHGKGIFQYTATDPAFSKLMDDAMACGARVTVPAIIDGCPEVFEGLGSLVDIGGGNGTTLSIVVKACPWIHGINFDLPHVVSVAPKNDGVEHVGGDMFDSIPNADAAYLMRILHDWGDEECIHILRKCRDAIPRDKGKVIILEAVIEEKETDQLKDLGLMMDMVMMAYTGKGKERTLKEWAYLLNEAGFSRHSVKHIQAVESVIEAYI